MSDRAFRVDVPGLRHAGRWLGVDEPWTRPRPPVSARDWWVAAVATGTCLILIVALAALSPEYVSSTVLGWNLASAGVLFVPMLLRRRYPIVAGLSTLAHMLFLFHITTLAVSNLATLVVYFVAVFSMVAWAPERKSLVFACGALITAVSLWMLNQFAGMNAVRRMSLDEEVTITPERILATVVVFCMVNAFFYGGAIALGRQAWWQAYTDHQLKDSIELAAIQSEELKERAVHDDRLRIARDLHDVVSHSVAAAGVHAGSVARVLSKSHGDEVSPAVFDSLRVIQDVSRTAVAEMRQMVGAMRVPGDSPDLPDLADLNSLVETHSGYGLHVHVDIVGDALDSSPAIPNFVSRSLYRVAQEALSNVTKHSTGRLATVTLRRADAGSSLEIEVVNDGNSRLAQQGQGFGLAGIRERAAALRGECEIGSRSDGGFGVRVRVPLDSFAR